MGISVTSLRNKMAKGGARRPSFMRDSFFSIKYGHKN